MATNGNDTARWEKLLHELDEKLQLGLLERLRRVSDYHFEGDILYLVTSSQEDYEYLTKDSVKTQLQIFANDACQVQSIIVNRA